MKRFVIKFELFGFTCTRTVRAADLFAAQEQATIIEKVLKGKGVSVSRILVEVERQGERAS